MITNNYLILIFLTAWNWQFFDSEILQNRNCINKRVVSHCGNAIYIKKCLKAKEELWKLKYFIMQKFNLASKNPL
jgi:hypothetical protein